MYKRLIYCSNCPYEWDCSERSDTDKSASVCSEYKYRQSDSTNDNTPEKGA